MGIDFLDLTFRMEKHFRMKIDMSFWGDILASAQQKSPKAYITDLTAGQVHQELARRLMHEGRLIEASYLAEENRKDVLSKLSERFPTQAVALDKKLQELFGHQLWKKDWYELHDMFGIEIPEVSRSRWTSWILGFCLVISVALWCFCVQQGPALDVGGLIAVALNVILIVWGISSYLLGVPPPNWSVQQLADRALLTRTSEDEISKWSEDLIWLALSEIICDTLCVECDAVSFDARLIRDLGAS